MTDIFDIEAAAREALEQDKKTTEPPWVDYTQLYYERCAEDKKRRKKWYHGSQRRCQPVALIASGKCRGELIMPEDLPGRVDLWDLKIVFGRMWSSIKGSIVTRSDGMVYQEDREWICAARTREPLLAAEVLRLRGLIRWHASRQGEGLTHHENCQHLGCLTMRGERAPAPDHGMIP